MIKLIKIRIQIVKYSAMVKLKDQSFSSGLSNFWVLYICVCVCV